jgi:hypothetical protein
MAAQWLQRRDSYDNGNGYCSYGYGNDDGYDYNG